MEDVQAPRTGQPGGQRAACRGPTCPATRCCGASTTTRIPARHTNQAGNSAPLGLEIRQTTFAFNRQGALGNTIFIKLEIIHPALSAPTDTVYRTTLQDMYVSLWADPDLGGATDDLVGCDTTLSLGYCYNATNNDQIYGSAPPAVGYDFFLGPRTPAGDTLGLTSFNKYINGTDPASSGRDLQLHAGPAAGRESAHQPGDAASPRTTSTRATRSSGTAGSTTTRPTSA